MLVIITLTVLIILAEFFRDRLLHVINWVTGLKMYSPRDLIMPSRLWVKHFLNSISVKITLGPLRADYCSIICLIVYLSLTDLQTSSRSAAPCSSCQVSCPMGQGPSHDCSIFQDSVSWSGSSPSPLGGTMTRCGGSAGPRPTTTSSGAAAWGGAWCSPSSLSSTPSFWVTLRPVLARL